MDVAQIITSAVMPGAVPLSTPSELPVGASAASPLFREMFAKAALAAEIPGTPQLGEKGAALSAQGLTLSGGASLLKQGEPVMTGEPEVTSGNHGDRSMARRQLGEEIARTPGQRELSLDKKRENSAEVKGARAEGQLEAEIVTDSEHLLTRNLSVRELSAEGSDPCVSKQGLPRQASAENSELPALETLPTGLGNERLIVPIVQNTVHSFKVGVSGIAAQSLPEAASATAQAVADSVRGTLLAGQNNGTVRMEPRPVGAGGLVEVLGKNGGSAAEKTGKELNPSQQAERTELTVVPAKPIDSISAGNRLASGTAEVSAGTAVRAGLSVTVSSPDVKETTDGVLVGNKMTGKDHFKPGRNENGTAVGQILQDSKAEGKGEPVVRELPGGVTVLNPAQTVTMGQSAISVEAPSLAVSASNRGRISAPDGEARDEKGREISVTGESEKLVLKQEGFSAQGNSTMSHDSETGGGNHGFSPASVSSGSFDTVIKGRMEPLSEVPRESEVSALHENIVSQVREKLLNQDPTGTVSKITLKLNPHELGELQINVRLENQKMTVDITAQNQVVKEALLQNLDQLKETLLRQNISMERFNVSTGDGGGQAFQQSFREGRQTEYQTPGTFSYPVSGYYQEDSQLSQAAFGDARENSLVDMRF